MAASLARAARLHVTRRWRCSSAVPRPTPAHLPAGGPWGWAQVSSTIPAPHWPALACTQWHHGASKCAAASSAQRSASLRLQALKGGGSLARTLSCNQGWQTSTRGCRTSWQVRRHRVAFPLLEPNFQEFVRSCASTCPRDGIISYRLVSGYRYSTREYRTEYHGTRLELEYRYDHRSSRHTRVQVEILSIWVLVSWRLIKELHIR